MITRNDLCRHTTFASSMCVPHSQASRAFAHHYTLQCCQEKLAQGGITFFVISPDEPLQEFPAFACVIIMDPIPNLCLHQATSFFLLMWLEKKKIRKQPSRSIYEESLKTMILSRRCMMYVYNSLLLDCPSGSSSLSPLF